MGKVERAIKAIEALPPHQQEEVAEMVLELAQAIRGGAGQSALSDEQLAIVRERRASGFRRGDASRIDDLLERLK